MRKIPSLAIGMVEALEFKGNCLSALVQMLGTRDVSERLSMLLTNLGETHGARDKNGICIGSPFTHEVFAQMVGASRQWVTITLDRFQREGLIRVGKRKTSSEVQRSSDGVNLQFDAHFAAWEPTNCQVIDRQPWWPSSTLELRKNRSPLRKHAKSAAWRFAADNARTLGGVACLRANVQTNHFVPPGGSAAASFSFAPLPALLARA